MRTLAPMLGLFFALPVAGQQDSLMREVIRLATEGHHDSARSIIDEQLQRVASDDPTYPFILFTAGVAAPDVEVARSYFRQVGIEYPNSPWADQALLRLAQFSWAEGDLPGAVRSAERVLRDYPDSDARAGAAFLLARARLDQRDVVDGCRYLREAQDLAGEDLELANRAAFYLQRCAGVASEPEPEGQAQPAGRTTYSVQVAAVQDAAAADDLMASIQAEGYDAHVVVEQGLFKVRVGRFARRAEASTLVQELRSRLGGQPFVVESR